MVLTAREQWGNQLFFQPTESSPGSVKRSSWLCAPDRSLCVVYCSSRGLICGARWFWRPHGRNRGLTEWQRYDTKERWSGTALISTMCGSYRFECAPHWIVMLIGYVGTPELDDLSRGIVFARRNIRRKIGGSLNWVGRFWKISNRIVFRFRA